MRRDVQSRIVRIGIGTVVREIIIIEETQVHPQPRQQE
jgi:hypothetical protein